MIRRICDRCGTILKPGALEEAADWFHVDFGVEGGYYGAADYCSAQCAVGGVQFEHARVREIQAEP